MSEGGQAVSGKYLLNFIKPDSPVLAHCDMKTEGRVRQSNRMDTPVPGIKVNDQVFCQVQSFFAVSCNSDHLLEGTLGKDCYYVKGNLEFFLMV